MMPELRMAQHLRLALRLATTAVLLLGVVTAGSSNADQMQALESFRDMLQRSNPQVRNFSRSENPCKWKIVQCNATGSVEGIDLSNMNLTGEIPSGIEIPSHITSFNLARNNLSGAIPSSIFGSSSSACKSLRKIDLSYNKFSSSIPTSLANCSSLVSIDLDTCGLTGSIPSELGQLSSLEQLNLANNELGGQIPASLFANCGNLQALDLSLNNFTGTVPLGIGNCTSLKNATFSRNSIEELPAEIGKLTQLQSLMIGNNLLRWLPSALANCTELEVLIANHNRLSGEIPSFIDDLRQLQYLALHANNLRGRIPDWLVNNHNTLVHLDLSNNQLSGGIPKGFGAFRSLLSLFLANNMFEGNIPESLGDAARLLLLDLSGNKLTGGIPTSIGKLNSLLWLNLARNGLWGAVPAELGNCSSLLWLNAAYNKLTGSIPAALETLGRNASATFQANTIRGYPLTPRVNECGVYRRWLPADDFPPFDILAKSTEQLDRERCEDFRNTVLLGKTMFHLCAAATKVGLETLGYVQLSGNRLSGSIPTGLTRISRLTILFLYQNNLTGPIPPDLGSIGIANINLSRNSLTGPIPPSFSEIKCLQALDLSYNNLNGSIPSSLTALTALTRFNVSYNRNLTGPIPIQQQFATFDEFSYIGDDQLCYASDLIPHADSRIPHCGESAPNSTTPRGRRSGHLSTFQILAITFGCAFAVVAAAIIYKSLRNPFSFVKGPNRTISIFKHGLPQQLTYQDMVTATGSFDKTRVIGSGGFGIVYRAVLPNGSTVAIKQLVKEGPSGDKEFTAEVATIGYIEHENLVPLLGYSHYGDQKLLVYKYMENGSLEDWLHPQHQERSYSALGWKVRLAIAVGTARGLAFLHHNCNPAIIHRDMKACNILLDGYFRPRLTDFGLARVLTAQEETHVSTIIAGTLGYVPPEYCQTWRATVKGDVYSFGVVLLELLSSKKPMFDFDYCANRNGNEDECATLVELASKCWKLGTFEELFDPVVSRTAPREQLVEFLKVALDCTQDGPVHRPTMIDVQTRLEDIENKK